MLYAIAARIPDVSSRIQVAVVRFAGSDATGTVSVSLPERPLVPRGRVQVPVSVDGSRVGSALLHVAHFDSVAIYPESAFSGDMVQAELLRFVWMDVTRFSGEPLTRTALAAYDGQELIARTAIRPDRALRRNDIGPRPAADTGDPVRMTYRRGAFVLELACRARDRGRVGDTIRVYADDSDTVYRARLTAPGRAEWIETL